MQQYQQQTINGPVLITYSKIRVINFQGNGSSEPFISLPQDPGRVELIAPFTVTNAEFPIGGMLFVQASLTIDTITFGTLEPVNLDWYVNDVWLPTDALLINSGDELFPTVNSSFLLYRDETQGVVLINGQHLKNGSFIGLGQSMSQIAAMTQPTSSLDTFPLEIRMEGYTLSDPANGNAAQVMRVLTYTVEP